MFEADFQIAQANQIVGTPIYVVFAYRNQGPHELSFSIGNGRSDSYRFHASPTAEIHDPYYEFGGLTAITKISPHGVGANEVLLNRYLQFLHPDRYVVDCELDLDVTESTTNITHAYRIRSRLRLDVRVDPIRQQSILTSLESDLMSHDVVRQMRAAQALSELREVKAIPIMMRGLKSHNNAVVEGVLLGLGRIGNDESKAALRAFLDSTSSPQLKDLARQELKKIGREPSRP